MKSAVLARQLGSEAEEEELVSQCVARLARGSCGADRVRAGALSGSRRSRSCGSWPGSCASDRTARRTPPRPTSTARLSLLSRVRL
jgi:hypothetical protein